jgi:hypothetical protein
MITVYDNEKEFGDKLQDNVVHASCQILPRKHKVDPTKLSLATDSDRDLYRLYTIMVSAGINKNDDVFTKKELWTAKDTPIDKPLNVEHSPRNIVGHIIESRMIDDQYQPIDEYEDDEEEDEEVCHILTGGVIYKHINSIDPELEQERAKLIEEIDNGEWYVSMECLFNDFDYALIHPVFGKRCIKRNESTSFLTKYLRIYGGDGHYNGMVIGRVLKGLLFSGKGLVKNPANPNSIILNNVSSFSGAYASLEDLQLINDIGDINMADDFETKYNESQNEIKELRERLVQAGEEQHKNELQSKNEEITQLATEITNLKTQISDLTAKFNEVSKAKEEVDTAKASLDKELKDKAEEINRINAEKVKVDRISILVNAGVEKSEAEKLTDRFSGISDEQFADIVELQKKIIVSASVTETKEVEVEAKEEVIDEKVLETAEVDTKEVSLATETTSEDRDQKLMTSFAGWLNSIYEEKK